MQCSALQSAAGCPASSCDATLPVIPCLTLHFAWCSFVLSELISPLSEVRGQCHIYCAHTLGRLLLPALFVCSSWCLNRIFNARVKPVRSSKPQKAGFEKNRIVASGLQWAPNTASSPSGSLQGVNEVIGHIQWGSAWGGAYVMPVWKLRDLAHSRARHLDIVSSLPAPFALHSEDASLFHKSSRNKNKKA